MPLHLFSNVWAPTRTARRSPRWCNLLPLVAEEKALAILDRYPQERELFGAVARTGVAPEKQREAVNFADVELR